MRKRISSIFLAVAMIFCIIPLSAYADEHQHTFENKHGYDLSNLPEGYSIPCKIYESPCSSECGYSLYSWDVFGLSGQFVDKTGTSGLVVYQHYREWFEKIYGRNATAKQYQTGGGSAGTGGVGRRPSGYADDTGTPSVSPTGAYTVSAPLRLYPLSIDASSGKYAVDSPTKIDNYSFTSGNIAIVGTPSGIKVTNGGSSDANIEFGGGYRVNVSAAGYLSVASGVKAYTGMGSYRYSSDDAKELWSIEHPYRSSNKGVFGFAASKDTTYFVKFGIKGDYNDKTTSDFTSCDVSVGFNTITKTGSSNKYYLYPYWSTLWIPHNTETFLRYDSIPVSYVMNTTSINQTNNITINKNTWNGNIYQDNSTNLTYIYPQYTTVNENNETVTNISNNPIIYNNETKQYYTYDTVTNNYYYITYETPTPSPSPDPDPTPTPEPGGDTGDTTGILAVLVEIRDNMVQGFLDLKAALVQGWADLSANFTLAIENLNLNITNIFNKKFPDQSTPETARPSPSPSPSPEPVDPILPDTQNYIIPKMNSNTFADGHGTWIASGSSKYSDVFDFFHAFDRSTSDFWETNVSPSYLQIEMPDPENYYIDGYIMRISKFDNRYPKGWTLQGSDDGETWDDLDTQAGQNLSDKAEHKYTLTLRKAYKYYRLNMSNYASSMCSLSHFNLLGYDAKDVVTPTPSPSPTPDPGETPTPTPAPTDKPSGGNTNNFWNFVFPGGNDDGTENGHKGILWALISLLIAVVTFVLGLGSAYSYVFPFLPAGLVTTIHICVLVLLLFAIIKFVRSFL